MSPNKRAKAGDCSWMDMVAMVPAVAQVGSGVYSEMAVGDNSGLWRR